MAKETTTPSTQVEDAPQQVDLDPGMALERLDAWVDGFVRLLPNIILALVVLAIFYGISIFIHRTVKRYAEKQDRNNLGSMLGGFARWAVLLTGFMLAATIVVPTLKPGDLIAGLGVSSVAIGFAFKDILQNWLAGLLILLRQPFEIDDQIKASGYEGTVERIETRATIIKTYDGQRAVIPNSEIYTSAVLVKTAHKYRRSQYDIGIGYGDDIAEACEVLRKAVAEVDGVQSDPATEALPWDLAASWVTIRVRWWTASHRADVVKVKAAVIKVIKESLDEARIDMPNDTYVQLLHDQTDATDGDREAQREGWPAPKEGAPEPGWKVRGEGHQPKD